VHRAPSEELLGKVDEEIKKSKGMLFHSYDDPFLILGNAR